MQDEGSVEKMNFLKVAVVTFALSISLCAENSVWEAPQVKGSSGREVLDATIARVNGRNMYLSKLRQPQMDKEGSLPTLSELLDKQVIMSRAESLSLIPTETEIQKQIEAFKAQFKAHAQGAEDYDSADQWLKDHGMSNKDLAHFYREQIAVNNVMHFYSVDKPLIPREDIEAYYKAHPVNSEAEYHLKTAVLDGDQVLDFDNLDHEKHDWIDLDFVSESKISEEMSFVHTLEVGKASKPVKTPAGYQTVMVVEKKSAALVPLVIRAPEIERILTKEALKKTMDLFMQDLKSNASAVVFKPL